MHINNQLSSKMESTIFKNLYRIASARASWHSYNGGAYYVTVNTTHHIHYFGKIYDGKMHLTAIGQFVSGNLQNVADHYPYAEIPLFVVMPNHFHAIVLINGNKTPSKRRVIAGGCGHMADDCDGLANECGDVADVDVGLANECGDVAYVDVGLADECRDAARHVSTGNGKNVKMQKISNHSGWLSVCIGGIKSAVTKFARENNICFDWQTRFHDRIIRDIDEMDRIVDYIENNVARWQQKNHHQM